MSTSKQNETLIPCLYRLGDSVNLECIDLSLTDKVNFGRHTKNDVCLTESSCVSRHHAALKKVEGQGWTVIDLGSSNGVYMDGVRIAPHQPVPLTDRCILEIGRDPKLTTPAVYSFRFHQAAKVRRSTGENKAKQENPDNSVPMETNDKENSSPVKGRRVTRSMASRLSLKNKNKTKLEAPSSAVKAPTAKLRQNLADHETKVNSPTAKLRQKLADHETEVRREMEARSRAAEEKITNLQELLLNKEDQLEAQQDLLLQKEDQLAAQQTAMDEHEKNLAAETISSKEHRLKLEAIKREKELMVEKIKQEKAEQETFTASLYDQLRDLKLHKEAYASSINSLQVELKMTLEKQDHLEDERAAIQLNLEQERHELDMERAKYTAERFKLRQEVETLSQSLQSKEVQLSDQRQRLSNEKAAIEASIKEEMEKKLAAKDAKYEMKLRRQQEQLQEKLAETAEEQETLKVEIAQMQVEVERERAVREEREIAAQANDIRAEMEDILDTELVCSICSELFVQAVSLNCAHSYCNLCISKWRNQKQECPVCRTKISSSVRSIVLDNYIERVLTFLGADLQDSRKLLLEERAGEMEQWQQQERNKRPVAPPQPAQPARAPRNNPRFEPVQAPHSRVAEVVPNQLDQQRYRVSRWHPVQSNQVQPDPNWAQLYGATSTANQQSHGQQQFYGNPFYYGQGYQQQSYPRNTWWN